MSNLPIKGSHFILIVICSLFLSCQKSTQYQADLQAFSSNTHQNELYSIWSLFYSDSIESKEQRKRLFRNNMSWSIQEEQQKKDQLINDYSLPNTFDIVDSLIVRGAWVNYGEKSDKSLDTIIELKINCILAKIQKDNHCSWIIKRIETATKYINKIKVNISPDFYYTIVGNNRIVSGLSLNINIHQAKVIYGRHLDTIEFEYDELQKKISRELFNQSEVGFPINSNDLGYNNVYSRYEGELFTPKS